jgi:hypothetical protein
MLKREGGFDVGGWLSRLAAVTGRADDEAPTQEDLFREG